MLRERLEHYFEFRKLGAAWRTELLAGLTTFVTMAYIVLVNPSILRDAGMPVAAVTAATCISAAVGSILMGAWARYPIALAPGMGLNAYFTYVVVKGLGVDWRVALGAVFLSGVLFLLLTFLGIRQLILRAIPQELYASVAVGIGLFIAFIGLRNAGIVVADPGTLVRLGNLRSPGTLLAAGGIVLTAALLARAVPGAILLGIAATAFAGLLAGLTHWGVASYSPAELAGTLFQLDIAGALRLGLVEIIFVFLFVDLFDNIGTLVAVGKQAGLFEEDAGRIPRIGRILTCDASATVVGSLAGTSTVVSYIESAAGVAAGGRTGIPAVVTGLLFLAATFVAPLLGTIPPAATAPALILVGAMMMTHAAEIEWRKMTVAVPAFLTILAIPLTFSIANGLSFGFTAYTLIHIASGQARKVNWLVYVLTALLLLRFYFLGAG